MLERSTIHFPKDARVLINTAYRINELSIVGELIEEAVIPAENVIAIRDLPPNWSRQFVLSVKNHGYRFFSERIFLIQ